MCVGVGVGGDSLQNLQSRLGHKWKQSSLFVALSSLNVIKNPFDVSLCVDCVCVWGGGHKLKNPSIPRKYQEKPNMCSCGLISRVSADRIHTTSCL